MTKHFIRYRVASTDNPINSKEGSFEVWADERPKQPGWRPPAKVGDTVWLLSGTSNGGGSKRYKLDYYFEVGTSASLEENRFYLRGTNGQFLGDEGRIDNAPWFAEFFQSIGRGGISFQEIKPPFLQHFEALQGTQQSPDRLEQLIEKSDFGALEEDSTVYRAIRQRRGQPDFRRRLIQAYGGKCCVTGCAIVDLLEAAHIAPHADGSDYTTRNGLLLRADIHTLFDLYLVAVDEHGRIVVSNKVDDGEYHKLHGRPIAVPDCVGDLPSPFALAQRLMRLTELDGSAPKQRRLLRA